MSTIYLKHNPTPAVLGILFKESIFLVGPFRSQHPFLNYGDFRKIRRKSVALCGLSLLIILLFPVPRLSVLFFFRTETVLHKEKNNTRQTDRQTVSHSLRVESQTCECSLATGWRRLIGCLKLQVICHKRANNDRALLQKMNHKDKAS